MTIHELAILVKKTRDAQERFLRSPRNPDSLAEARTAEKKLDATVRDVLNPPMRTLFDGLEDGEKDWVQQLAESILEDWREWDGEAGQLAQNDQDSSSYDRHMISCLSDRIRSFKPIARAK